MNRFLQVDEVRKEEDYEPINFNFVSLGLGDVLLNPQTNEIYTPNTNQITHLNDELRAKDDYVRDDHGRFAGRSAGAGGKSSKNQLTQSAKEGKIKEKKNTVAKMTRSERKRVSKSILTDHPRLKADGCDHIYEHGDYIYTFSVIEPGTYNFLSRKSIEKYGKHAPKGKKGGSK